MNDHRRPQNDRFLLRQSEIRRRNFLAGSLAAGAVAFAGTPAWAQNGATVPQVCVPPIPPG
jgi:TAT (twin-arginine translocation) pathway signal sequence